MSTIFKERYVRTSISLCRKSFCLIENPFVFTNGFSMRFQELLKPFTWQDNVSMKSVRHNFRGLPLQIEEFNIPYLNWYSQAVTDLSSNRAHPCLNLMICRESWYSCKQFVVFWMISQSFVNIRCNEEMLSNLVARTWLYGASPSLVTLYMWLC